MGSLSTTSSGLDWSIADGFEPDEYRLFALQIARTQREEDRERAAEERKERRANAPDDPIVPVVATSRIHVPLYVTQPGDRIHVRASLLAKQPNTFRPADE